MIEIGNQLFVDLLINEITQDKKKQLMIKEALMKKSEDVLNQLDVGENKYMMLLRLLFDPANELSEIKSFIVQNELNPKLLDELKRTLKISSALNQDNIFIDLGLISPYDYYNGPIFKGYFKGVNKDVFRGGRYDTLTKNYGTLTKALGFSLDIDALMNEVL